CIHWNSTTTTSQAMVRVNCDYIPAWPFVYYKNKTNVILHILWPFITWKETISGYKVLALFYFLFRLTWNERKSTQYVDIFWPIIHLEYNDNGFRFGIRPLFWLVWTDKSFKFILFGLITIVSKDGGDDMWVVIAPFIWFRKDGDRYFFTLAPILWITGRSNNERLKIVLLPVGVFSRSSSGNWWLNIAFLFHLAGGDDFYYCHLLPLFVVTGNDNGMLFIFMFLYYYIRRQSSFTTLLLLAFFYRSWDEGKSRFLNICLLFNYRHLSGTVTNVVLFPLMWIRSVSGHSFTFHLWPAFGFKVSQKSRGFNVYVLYPIVIYKNKHGGAYKRFMFFYALIHYLHDKEERIKLVIFLPIFLYRRMQLSSSGFILLYFWHRRRRQINIQMEDIQRTTSGGDPDLSDVPVANMTKHYKLFYDVQGFLPFVFYVRNQDLRSLVVLPVLLLKWHTDTINSTLLAPLFYQRRRGTDLVRWLLPLFYHKQSTHGEQERTITLSPLYYYWQKGDNHFRFILPVFVDFVKGESHLVYIFPTLIHYRKSIFKFETFFPFYFRIQDAAKNELFTYYFPFWGSGFQGSKWRSYYFLFPLFAYKEDPERHAKIYDILFPLFHFDRDDESHSIRILPFFWRSVNERNEMLLIMPLFWRFVTDKDRRPQINTLFLPFYFKRDSAQYLFTFASPALLPPYYIHYHREASQVEKTFVFPFYAHKIKGLDHLRWFLLVLYRHTWRDFSEDMYMNILLYFKFNNSKLSVSGFVPLWVQWLVKDKQHYHLRVLLLYAYDRMKSSLKHRTRVSILYLITNRVALFCEAMDVVATTIDPETGEPRAIEMTETSPTPGGEDYNGATTADSSAKRYKSTKVYFFPLFHFKRSEETSYYQFALLWLAKPYVSFLYRFKGSDESVFHIFLAYYFKRTDSWRQVALVWFFHPVVSCFLYEDVLTRIIVRVFPIFWFKRRITPDNQVGSKNLSIIYIVPRYGLFNYRCNQSNTERTHYFLPLYYYSRQGETDRRLAIIWFAHPIVSLFTSIRDSTHSIHRLFPIFYRYSSSQAHSLAGRSGIAFVWIGHPDVSLVRYHHSTDSSIFAIFPILWTKWSHVDEKFQLSIVYIVRGFGLIDYRRKSADEVRFYMLPIIHVQTESTETNVSIVYLVHPLASFIRFNSSSSETKFFVFLLIYILSGDDRSNFSLLWLGDPRASFIGYWSKGNRSHFHIALAFWLSFVDENMQLGLLWLGCLRASGGVYYPIALFLSFSDGSYYTSHLIPVYRYTNRITAGHERLWILFGMIYLVTKADVTDFRWCYRWIRVKSGPSVSLVEVNPFIHYKRKSGNSRLLFLGGMCGYDDSARGGGCRVCCIEC
ncbi:hypothetical protein SAMD00019534_120090, partial [Acytostelium subglobosum LB1]|uniref:hypothetical protein n=1 Tax=Acytostelium subglobosum LB1 TaxID=1410327 RepID=UPI000644D1F8